MSVPSYVDLDFHVKVTESSMTDTILPSVLLGDFQESAEAGVQIFGIDTPVINERGFCWIVLRMSVELKRLPKWKESFKIRTWSCGAESLCWRRDYQIIDGNGDVIGSSTSEWIIADINTHRPIRPKTLIAAFEDYPDCALLATAQNDMKAIDYSSPKLSFPDSLSELGNPVISKFADYSELDHNHHVNNTKYIAWAYDALFKSGVDVDTINSFDINYHSEVKNGERVDLYLTELDGYKYVYGYKNNDEKVFIFRCN